MTSTPRALTVDEGLVRRMARDAAIYSLTRPLAIVMWIVLVTALGISIVNLSLRASLAPDAIGSSAWLPPLVLLVMTYATVLTMSSARRAVRTAMPPGTRVWVSINEESLQMGSGQRRSNIRYSTFQSIRIGRDAVLLRLRNESVATAIPRALFSDADLTMMRAKLG